MSKAAPELMKLLDLMRNPQTNTCIADRLEVMHAWFQNEAWNKGAKVYLMSALAQYVDRLACEDMTHDQVQYARGIIAALRLLLKLPDSIDTNLGIKEKQDNAPSRGDAGY